MLNFLHEINRYINTKLRSFLRKWRHILKYIAEIYNSRRVLKTQIFFLFSVSVYNKIMKK